MRYRVMNTHRNLVTQWHAPKNRGSRESLVDRHLAAARGASAWQLDDAGWRRFFIGSGV